MNPDDETAATLARAIKSERIGGARELSRRTEEIMQLIPGMDPQEALDQALADMEEEYERPT